MCQKQGLARIIAKKMGNGIPSGKKKNTFGYAIMAKTIGDALMSICLTNVYLAIEVYW